METIEQITHRIVAALNKGKECARLIKIGDTFNGAMSEAIKHYPANSPEYDIFIFGYLKIIQDYDIHTDEENRVIKFQYRGV